MNTGFTLIEVLVALLLLTIVLPVALESQIIALRLEQAARAAQAVRFEIDRVMAETLCGRSGTNTGGAATPACDVRRSSVQVEENPARSRNGGGLGQAYASSTELIQWEIVPKDRPSLKTVVFTHPLPE